MTSVYASPSAVTVPAAADVDDADLAVLEEVVAADLGVAREREWLAGGNGATEDDAVVVCVDQR